MQPWKVSSRFVLHLFLHPVLQGKFQVAEVMPGVPGIMAGGVGNVEEPLADGRHPDFAPQGLELPHCVFVGEMVGPGIDFAHDADDGFAAVGLQGQVIEGAPGLAEHGRQVLPVPHRFIGFLQVVLIDLVGFAGITLIGPGLPQLFLQKVDGHYPLPDDPGVVFAHHADFLVHAFALIRGNRPAPGGSRARPG